MRMIYPVMRLSGALVFSALSLFSFQSQAAGETIEYQAEGKRFTGHYNRPVREASGSRLSAPLLIHHGSADKVVSFAELTELAQALEDTKIPNEIVSYGGAPHGFTVFDTDAYSEQADQASWRRLEEFLASTLGFRSFLEP